MKYIQRYGWGGVIKYAYFYLITKLFYRSSRLIRLPIDIRNKKYIDLGKGLTTGIGCRIEALPLKFDGKYVIKIGNNVEINDYVHIAALSSVKIEDNVLIASKVFISDLNHGDYGNNDNCSSPILTPNERPLSSKPVKICKNVWIGESVSILPGVTIGEGSIIGANSVVTISIPEYSIAVGSPAKVIKKFNFETNTWIKV